MGHSCLIAFMLTSVHFSTILSITTAREKNFPHHIDSPAPPTNWENGLREAIFQMLIREGYSHPNLREYLSLAPILGQRNTATPFGDIAVLARGQLYFTNAGFAFIQDPNSYDCDECDEHKLCRTTNCQWSKPQDYGTLLAIWTARRIRHRDRNYGHRYEIQYIISPVHSNSRGAFTSKNGVFNYNIPGHVFALKDTQASEQQGCKWCNHHENYVTRTHLPVTQQSYKSDREYLPPYMTVTEVNRARSKGGFLLDMNPNDGKYILQSLPDRDGTRSHQVDADELQKEIELYIRLLQSLTSQRPQTESITTPLPSTTRFIPNTTPVFMTHQVSSADMLQEVPPIESPSIETAKPEQKTTIPYQATFMDFVGKTQMPKTSTMQVKYTKPMTTPSTKLYSKTVPLIHLSTPITQAVPFKPSPGFVRYSEPDPLYHPSPMMYTTTRKQFFSTSQKPTSSTVPSTTQKHKVYVTKANVTTTKSSFVTSPTFKPTKSQTEASIGTTEAKQPRENASDTQISSAEATIPYEQTSITSITTESEQTPPTTINKLTELYYKGTESTKQDQETTKVLKEGEIDYKIEENTTLYEETTMVPTTKNVLIRQESQQNLSTPHTISDDKTTTEVIPTSREIIETQETLSIPHTTMKINNNELTQSKLTSFTTVTFFNVKETDDISTESSTPQQKTVYTMRREGEKHTTSLPSSMRNTEGTTELFTILKIADTTEVQTQSSFYETFSTTAINSDIPASTEVPQTTTDEENAKTEKELNLLDEIFGTVITDPVVKSTTAKSATQHKNTKEIDELFEGEILSETVSDSELTTKQNVKIIFANFYLAEPTTETLSYMQELSENEESSKHISETIKETQLFSDQITTQPVTVPTSQSYSTSISFEVNKRNKSRSNDPESNEKVKAKLTEIKLNDTEFMIYKAELPEKKSDLLDDKEMSPSNTFDAIALTLVNHARSIDYINKKCNKTKPRRKYRKSKHYQKKIT